MNFSLQNLLNMIQGLELQESQYSDVATLRARLLADLQLLGLSTGGVSGGTAPIIWANSIPGNGFAWSRQGAAVNANGALSQNSAYFLPFTIPIQATYNNIFVFNGSTINGNIDVGIYDFNGALVVKSGSVAHAGASAIQDVPITPTLLTPGGYFMALATDSATATFNRWNLSLASGAILGANFTSNASFPLPVTMVPAQTGLATFPLIGISQSGF